MINIDKIQNLVLDTCCFFCLTENEVGVENIQFILQKSFELEVNLFMSSVNYCEILYQIKRLEGPLYTSIREYLDTLPITIIDTNKEITEFASHIKSKAKISLGDSFAIATAMHLKCPVATTDRHEFTKWEKDVDIFWLR
jgi:PIN domain nuclease of toxin-antitoxin system